MIDFCEGREKKKRTKKRRSGRGARRTPATPLLLLAGDRWLASLGSCFEFLLLVSEV